MNDSGDVMKRSAAWGGARTYTNDRGRRYRSLPQPPAGVKTPSFKRSSTLSVWGILVDRNLWRASAARSVAFLASRGVPLIDVLARYDLLLRRHDVHGRARSEWIAGLRDGYREGRR